MDAEDKTPEAAAKREIEEEMGVEAVGWKPLGFWTWDTFDDTDRRFLVVYFECTTNQTPFLMEPHKCEGWELRHWQGDLEHVPPTELFSGLWHLGIRGFLG